MLARDVRCASTSQAGRATHQQSSPVPPVLVVGAGPVGLTAAAFLCRFGVPVRIIDARAAPTNLSKALVTWRRSLLTLDPLVPCEQWLREGTPLAGPDFADEGEIFASIRVHTPNLAPSPGATGGQEQQDQQQQQEPPGQHMLPTGMLVTQAEVEAQLTAVLQERYGVSVQRSTQLSAFTVDEAAGCVRCTLAATPPDHAADGISSPPGSSGGGSAGAAPDNAPHQQQQEQQQQGREVEEVTASFLIGCDGAHSAVRKGLGVSFPGYTYPDERWLLADAIFEHAPGINTHAPRRAGEGGPQPGRFMVSTSAGGTFGVLPLGRCSDRVRLVWNIGPKGPAEVTLADFQAMLLAHTRLQMRLKECLWLSEFAINERQVETYVHRNGRVLLAGDAAHVHSPAGGQGMNTGIQDAANLAWKVALVAGGDVSVAEGQQLLQTYQEERHPVGAAVVRASGALLRSQAIRHPVLRLLRRLLMSTLFALPAVQRRLLGTLAQDDIAYPSSSLTRPGGSAGGASAAAGAAACAGRGFPDVSISIGGAMRPATDLLRGGDGCFGTLVVVLQQGSGSGGSSSSSSGRDSRWPTHWGRRRLHVVTVAGQNSSGGGGGDAGASGGAPTDAWGLLAAAVGGCESVLVRPDGIIAAAGTMAHVTAWLEGHGFNALQQPSAAAGPAEVTAA